jgi:hypothetical protein
MSVMVARTPTAAPRARARRGAPGNPARPLRGGIDREAVTRLESWELSVGAAASTNRASHADRAPVIPEANTLPSQDVASELEGSRHDATVLVPRALTDYLSAPWPPAIVGIGNSQLKIGRQESAHSGGPPLGRTEVPAVAPRPRDCHPASNALSFRTLKLAGTTLRRGQTTLSVDVATGVRQCWGTATSAPIAQTTSHQAVIARRPLGANVIEGAITFGRALPDAMARSSLSQSGEMLPASRTIRRVSQRRHDGPT